MLFLQSELFLPLYPQLIGILGACFIGILLAGCLPSASDKFSVFVGFIIKFQAEFIC